MTDWLFETYTTLHDAHTRWAEIVDADTSRISDCLLQQALLIDLHVHENNTEALLGAAVASSMLAAELVLRIERAQDEPETDLS